MTREIGGFTVGPYSTDTVIAERIDEPQHMHWFRYTSDGVELLETVPATVSNGDPLEDAKRYEGEATAAAKKYRDLLSPAAAE
jgi:hypothetical protein